MNKSNQSDPIWISNNNNKNKMKSSSSTNNSYDSGFDSKSLSPPEYKRSFSSGSYTSTPSSPIGNNNQQQLNYGFGFTRRRTMTVGNDATDSNNNCYFGGGSPFTSSPFQFQRSNSISGEPNFGGIIKKSIGQLFNAATMNTSLATAPIQKSVPKVKCVHMDKNFTRRNSNERNDQLKDHMVSYLCESAIR